MLPLPLRNWLFGRWIRPNEKLVRVPLLSPGDLVFLPKLGLDVSGRFLKRHYLYRKNLKTSLPSGMVQVYPRSGYLLYYFFLFNWAEYCQVLPQLLMHPQLALIPEAFMRYVIEIDRQIDNPGGLKLLESGPDSLRSHPQVCRFRDQLMRQIDLASLPAGLKCLLLEKLAGFETDSLRICLQGMAQPVKTLKDVLTGKENTVGALFAEWVRLLGLVYGVQPERAACAGKIFWNTGMALQMLDDTIDAPLDHENQTENVFLHFARKSEKEWRELEGYLHHLKTTPWIHLDTYWASQHTPETLARVRDLGRGYLSRLESDTPATMELRWVMERLWAHTIGI